MLRANGIAPAAKKQKRKAELEDVKPDVIDIEDNNADEIRALEVSGHCFIVSLFC